MGSKRSGKEETGLEIKKEYRGGDGEKQRVPRRGQAMPGT